MSYHAKLSPSSAYRWTSCTASIDAQDGIENTDSDASRLGTCCHQIQAEILSGNPRENYLDAKMVFWSHAESESSGEDWSENYTDSLALQTHITGVVTVTQDMIDAVHGAVEFVRRVHEANSGRMYVEQSVPVGQFTGEAGATGSADVIILSGDHSHVWIADSKFGRNKVYAYDLLEPARRDIVTNELVPERIRPNLQLASYALGALAKFDPMFDVKTVTMTIIQPFVEHISEYTCTVEELREVERFLRDKALETRIGPKFVATQDNCHFCRASGKCAAQDAAILDAALIGFDDVTTATPKPVKDIELGTKFALVGMVQDWCKAVEARVMDALHSGQTVSRSDGLSYKLVRGKKGDRSWADETLAIDTMDNMGLARIQIFKQTLFGPAAIEKLSKAKKGTKPVLTGEQWAELQALITQVDGKPAIALETDPRPALASATEGFDDVPPVDNSDLF